MLQNKVAITGGTSATALWLTRAFSLKGWNTLTLCSRPENFYSGIKKERIKWLKTQAAVSFGVRAETHGFAQWVKENKPAIWIHHHHFMENYRSPNYNLARSLEEGITPLETLVGTLKENNCRGIILTGTYFEPGEGGLPPEMALPYGKSKSQIWLAMRDLSKAFKIRISKIVVPDSVGPLENEDRFLPQFIKATTENKKFELTSPNQIADHISMAALGNIYEAAARELLSSKGKIYRPSGWVGSYKEWAKFISENLKSDTSVDFKENATQSEDRKNPAKEQIEISWPNFFEEYLKYYKTLKPWRAP